MSRQPDTVELQNVQNLELRGLLLNAQQHFVVVRGPHELEPHELGEVQQGQLVWRRGLKCAKTL